MKIFLARLGQRHDSGFTLMELLVVISVLLLLMLIAIPNFSGMKIQANENSAIASVRSIYLAETQYAANYPTSGFACSLAQLGGSAKAGAASPAHAQVLPNDLAGGRKSGYTFKVVHCDKASVKASDAYTSFEVLALPQTVGKTGHRGFCIDQQGELRADLTGGGNCTQSVQ